MREARWFQTSDDVIKKKLGCIVMFWLYKGYLIEIDNLEVQDHKIWKYKESVSWCGKEFVF